MMELLLLIQFHLDLQITDISFGRQTDGGDNWILMTPTPGTTNNIVSVMMKNLFQLNLV